MANPAWTIRPNWSGGVTETLEWLTDVIAGPDGSEQRRALRLSPRRYFEFTVNPVDDERTFLDLCLQRLATQTWLLPLWHDKGRLDLAHAARSTRLHFDNAYREHVVGGQAIVFVSAFHYEVVTITGVDDDGLDIAPPGLVGDYAKGCAVYPLRLAYLDAAGSYSALTPRVGQAQVKWKLEQANDLDEGDETLTLLDGYPVFVAGPDWKDGISFDLQTLESRLDNTFGRVYRDADTSRSFATQAWSAFAVGRQQQRELRQMLYRQRGRQKGLWMPTFNADLRLDVAAAQGAGSIDVRKVGLGYTGGITNGRDRIIFPTTGEVARLSALQGTGRPVSERLALSAPLGHSYPKNALASFLAASRFDSDAIEIGHSVDSDGPVNVKVPIRNVSDTRDPSGVIYAPPAIGTKSSLPCGVPEVGSCVRSFEGWYWRIIYKIDRVGGLEDYRPGMNIYPRDTKGGPGFYTNGVDGTNDGLIIWNKPNWTVQVLVNTDVRPDAIWHWQIQYGRGTSNGSTCLVPYDDEYCTNHIYMQYWTDDAPHQVFSSFHFSLFPMEWEFQNSGEPVTGG